MKKLYLIFAAIVAVLLTAAYFSLTLFVIPPIGALPEGKTVIMTRLSVTKFIDTPEAICQRTIGNSSPFCMLMVMGAITEKSTLIAKLPYSEALYKIALRDR